MKIIRFTEVVRKSGRPEVYLLLTPDDAEFKKALKSNRIMTIPGEGHGSKVDHGVVGYDAKNRGQILLFPKSLKAFEGSRIVGIKYDLFADHQESPPKSSASTKAKPSKSASTRPKNPKHRQPEAKVIEFPKPEIEEEEDDSVAELKGYARQALKALEKGNSVAAYNLLKRIVE